MSTATDPDFDNDHKSPPLLGTLAAVGACSAVLSTGAGFLAHIFNRTPAMTAAAVICTALASVTALGIGPVFRAYEDYRNGPQI